MISRTDARTMVERLKNRGFRLALRDPSGDGAKLSIADAHMIEDLLQERDVLLQELEREQPETTESPASKPATPSAPF